MNKTSSQEYTKDSSEIIIPGTCKTSISSTQNRLFADSAKTLFLNDTSTAYSHIVSGGEIQKLMKTEEVGHKSHLAWEKVVDQIGIATSYERVQYPVNNVPALEFPVPECFQLM